MNKIFRLPTIHIVPFISKFISLFQMLVKKYISPFFRCVRWKHGRFSNHCIFERTNPLEFVHFEPLYHCETLPIDRTNELIKIEGVRVVSRDLRFVNMFWISSSNLEMSKNWVVEIIKYLLPHPKMSRMLVNSSQD